jgi:hypothetical protein
VVFANSADVQANLLRVFDAPEQLAHAVDGACGQASVVEPGHPVCRNPCTKDRELACASRAGIRQSTGSVGNVMRHRES